MRDEDLARHAFHQVGAYSGPTVFLYNEHANGIRHRKQLDRPRQKRGALDRPRGRPLLTDALYHQLAAQKSHADTRVSEHRNWRSGCPAQSAGLLPLQVAWAILVDGYPVRSREYETKDTKSFRDELRKRPTPELSCPECLNEDILIGEKSADGAKVQRWFDCPDCGYEASSLIVYGAER